MTILSHRRSIPLLLVSISLTPFLWGCESQQEIRSYTVEKVNETMPPVGSDRPAPAAGEPTDRMLGAIVPVGDQSWFFKVTGPVVSVDRSAGAINEFFHTIQVTAGTDKPVWKTPEGWEELGPSGMRAATLKIPSAPQPLEISVIASSGTLLDNVNRWRGQLQLPPLDESALAKTAQETKAGDATMWLVDLRGKAAPSGMMGPFAGAGPFSGGATPRSDLPPGHPPVAADGGPAESPPSAPLKFTTPESWQPQPVSGGMRKAAFLVKDGEKQAEITVIDLPASAPSVAEPLPNINRWRNEVGLGPIAADDLPGLLQKIEVDGKQSDYVELIPDSTKPEEAKADKATIAAIVPAGQMIWFIKLKGDRDLVVAQRDSFKSFLESIRFTSEGGAGDGN